MQTLEQAIRAKVEKDIQRLNEAEQRAQAEAARIKEAEVMASEDALVLIQREAGFTLDGPSTGEGVAWTCRATHSSTNETEDYFTVSLTYPSEYPNWFHQVNFDCGQKVSYLIIKKDGEARMMFREEGVTAIHILNGHGKSMSKGFERLLDALIFARFGNAEPEAILEALDVETR